MVSVVHGANFSGLSDEGRAELWASLALMELKPLGAAKRAHLVKHFASAYQAVQNSQLWSELGIKNEVASQYSNGRWREEARKKWDLIRESAENILLYCDQSYPALLREIPDSPLFLFYRGDISLLQNASVSIVGSRKCTREGMSVAVDIARGLSHAGITSISGLAKGIDRVVHLAGLEGDGSSIAVLGCGVDVPYPQENLDLYDLMQKKGLIISEFLPGSSPKQYNFPVRNRIISGLSRAVLVVEAAARSGTLITARHAAEQGRDVFAIPGSTISESSEGCRDLIRRGAKPVFSADDILLELAPILKAELEAKMKSKKKQTIANSLDEPGILPWGVTSPSAVQNIKKQDAALEVEHKDERRLRELCAELGKAEANILNLLQQKGSCHIDSICTELELEAAQASGMLAMLEIQGLVKRTPGMYYALSF